MSILLEISEAYKEHVDFKNFVDKYARDHRMLPEDCFHHAIVIETYRYYTGAKEEK